MEKNKDKKIDYLTVLIEDMKGDFKAFGDGLTDVSKKVNELDQKVDLLVEDMDYVKSEIVEIKDRFKETDNKLAKKADKTAMDDHETRIIKLESTSLAEA
jgi:peptidoglycan hydrolase CwlO-like protein